MKKLVLIGSIILFTAIQSQAQTRETPGDRSVAAVILKTYPNPASSAITFDFQKAYEKGYSLQVYNFLGRKMYESNNVNDRTTVELSSYTRGVYIYQLRDKTGKLVESGKFQVSK